MNNKTETKQLPLLQLLSKIYYKLIQSPNVYPIKFYMRHKQFKRGLNY